MSEETSVKTARVPTRGLAAFILAPEVRAPFIVLLAFLLVLGLALSVMGIWSIFSWSRYGGDFGASLAGGIVSLACGVLAFILAMALRQVRRYFHRIRWAEQEEEEEAKASAELTQRKEDAVARIQQLQKQRAQREFEKNLSSTITLDRFRASDMVLFPQANWEFQPGVNVLLGRNGFGKSLLLRALAGTLQNDEEVLANLLRPNPKSDEPFIEVALRRDGANTKIRKNTLRFVDSIGKVPLLAIPDSRFFDRSEGSIGPEDKESSDLRSYGAQQFMYQRPYGGVVRALLHGICLDYWENGKTFDLPVFEFFRRCVKGLTDYDFRFSNIVRNDIDFSIEVVTEGNSEPVPIQYASQGTLSVLAMFGLIRRYVWLLSGKANDDVVQTGSGIVLIDEADAHLHPAWQQKFRALLTEMFPNVQFILSAHSPLFVAGCWKGEVAVLRKTKSNAARSEFMIEQLDRDFVGATAAELYKQVFEIEELDSTYLEYATRATRQTDSNKRIEELLAREAEGKLSSQEEEELQNLDQERLRIKRAVAVQSKRRAVNVKDAQIDALKSQVLDLHTQLEKRS
jgi:ABC-type multidrug transport system ATPase subunit